MTQQFWVSEKKENTSFKRFMHSYVHCIIYKMQDMKAT